MVAHRLQQVEPSRTIAMNERAQMLRRRGVAILNLTAGEPDLPTPEPVQEAAVAAMRAGHTRYTPAAGIPELREAVAAYERNRLGVEIRPEEVIITCGGKQALYNFFMALLDPGDEVLIPTPCWVSFYEQVRLADGVPVFVSTSASHQFFPTVPDLDAHRSARTRALVLNTPCNPTGQVITSDHLRSIVQWALDHRLYIVFDECYAELTFPGFTHHHVLQVVPDARMHLVTVNTFSKTFCMTGWRVGWAVAPEEWIRAMTVVQSHSTTHAPSISQWAALTALQLGRDHVDTMRRLYAERAQYLLDNLRDLPGIRVYAPQGAFYLWIDVSEWLQTHGMDDMQLALRLLDEAHVATVPGRAFQAPGFLRISFAASQDTLEAAVAALRAFFTGT